MSTYCHGGKVSTWEGLIPLIEKYGKVVKFTRGTNAVNVLIPTEGDVKSMLLGAGLSNHPHMVHYDHGGTFSITTHKGKFIWVSSGDDKILSKE